MGHSGKREKYCMGGGRMDARWVKTRVAREANGSLTHVRGKRHCSCGTVCNSTLSMAASTLTYFQ